MKEFKWSLKWEFFHQTKGQGLFGLRRMQEQWLSAKKMLYHSQWCLHKGYVLWVKAGKKAGIRVKNQINAISLIL